MRFPAAIIPVLVAGALSASCAGNGADSTPRRHAYPRIAVYDSLYEPVDSFPLHFEANAQTARRIPRPGWLDIAYPAYGATLHISAMEYPQEELADKLAERRERMAMNLYGLTVETRHLTSADSVFEAVILVSGDATATPLQFLASDAQSLLVTGAAYLPGVMPDSPADSIAPIVEALERDIVHAIRNMRHDRP